MGINGSFFWHGQATQLDVVLLLALAADKICDLRDRQEGIAGEHTLLDSCVDKGIPYRTPTPFGV